MSVINILILLVTLILGIVYFVLGKAVWLLAALFLLVLLTRFNAKTKELGKYSEILFVFCLISFIINTLGINYPESLVIVLTFLILLIFYEGPAWSKLFFGFGETKTYFNTALLIAAASSLVFGAMIFFRRSTIENPIPLEWPADALIVLGLGFAFYLAIVEETIFRSFIFERAQGAAGSTYAVAIQGAFYGLMYYKTGVPAGIEGVVLGSLFGIALGYLVKKSGSIYLSMMVHVIVTFLVFLELLVLGKYQIQ